MRKFLFILIILIFIALVAWALYLFIFKDRETTQDGILEDQTAEVQIVPDVSENDQDRDGLTDEEERNLGTSNTEFDSDGDGLRDTAEIDIYKTDPTKRDTDGDGYADGWEVLKGFNPNGGGTI